MATILAGKTAPDFTLKSMDGGQQSLKEALKKGPVLAAFFKVSCPVCQFAFPFVQRMYERYGDKSLTIWGISQDDARDSKEFCKEFGIHFPILIDGNGYPASNAYGLTNVPTLFLIDKDGNTKVTQIGWAKDDMEKISAALARAAGKPNSPLFALGETIPDVKPG